jgi:hypothetical protein
MESMDATLRTRSPTASIEVSCTLRRTVGSPIGAQTVEIGPHGMQVRSQRPLSLDETVGFEIPELGMRVAGQARVTCVERANVYKLRFEGLSEPMARRLHSLATSRR